MGLDDSLFHDGYLIVTRAGLWIVAGWLFVLGAIIGSFLNVVVYRLPRSQSLSHPGSRCPACSHPIRWHDNIPILGWILLSGHCRDCRSPIARRYPLVELFVATICAGLFLVEGWTGGFGQLPEQPGMFQLSFGVFAFHWLLLCTLLAAALIEFDGWRPGMRMLAGVALFALILGACWPSLLNNAQSEGSHAERWEGITGFSAALVLAALAWPAWLTTGVRSSDLARGADNAAAMALVGATLGPWATSAITVAAAGIYSAGLLIRLTAHPARSTGWFAIVFLATLIHSFVWPFYLALREGPVEPSAVQMLSLAGLFVATISLLSQIVAQLHAKRIC